mmetsp:Transcript_52298/g.168440  ORF Transcript_52298/g.168440 Transcript_52298/m.168440 type:complete len:287 (-) Transcript_52298:31-891(-)
MLLARARHAAEDDAAEDAAAGANATCPGAAASDAIAGPSSSKGRGTGSSGAGGGRSARGRIVGEAGHELACPGAAASGAVAGPSSSKGRGTGSSGAGGGRSARGRIVGEAGHELALAASRSSPPEMDSGRSGRPSGLEVADRPEQGVDDLDFLCTFWTPGKVAISVEEQREGSVCPKGTTWHCLPMFKLRTMPPGIEQLNGTTASLPRKVRWNGAPPRPILESNAQASASVSPPSHNSNLQLSSPCSITTSLQPRYEAEVGCPIRGVAAIGPPRPRTRPGPARENC